MQDDDLFGEPVELEITDTLDLHSFLPHETAAVLKSYLDAAASVGLQHLRIIHGRGIGAQRRTVRAVLAQHPQVAEFSDALPREGGWGATSVTLKRPASAEE